MDVPRKTRYALRAIFELAKRFGQGPVKIADIAKAQAAPPRFLEVILGQLKQGGFVDSRRGKAGGYLLIRSPKELTVGQVMRFVQGPIRMVRCGAGGDEDCPLFNNCVFLPMWEEVQRAVAEVYDRTTFQHFVEWEKHLGESRAPSYDI